MAECGLGIPATAAFISGIDSRRDNAPFVNMLTLGQTCGAGTPWSDGWLTIAHVGNGGQVMRDSTEIDELMYPIRIWVVVTDSEGAGRRRGAPAGEVEWGPVDLPMEGIWSSDGSVFPALGARGGGAGARARQFRREKGGSLRRLVRSIACRSSLAKPCSRFRAAAAVTARRSSASRSAWHTMSASVGSPWREPRRFTASSSMRRGV